MAFTFTGGAFNVEGSLNFYFKSNINTNLPAWASAFAINYDYPDVPLFDEENGDYSPKFSLSHLGDFEDPGTQGDLLDGGNRGQKLHGILEVSCWANVKSSATAVNANWRRDLRQMRDMVTKLFSQTRTVQILNVYAGTTNPSATNYVIRIERVETIDTPLIEPNPNVRRRRILVHYCWTQRA